MSTASAQESELAAPIKRCIDSNASSVEKTVSSLSEATIFLVENVCADTIAAEQSRLSKIASQKMIDRYQQECAAEKSPRPKTSDPEEAAADPCMMAKSMSDMYGGTGWTIFTAAKQPEPGPTSYAAKLLLSLRLAHLKSNP
jgi:hypothetical protein